MVRLHMRIHSRLGVQFTDLKVRLENNIAATGLLDEPRKRDLLNRIADLPDGDRLCHGDFHPMNILGDASQPSSSIGPTRVVAILPPMSAVPTC